MKTITISEIQDGMILSDDVYERDGKVLLGIGTILSQRHQSLLGKRGVATVKIIDEDDSECGPSGVAAFAEGDIAESDQTLAAKAEIEVVFAEHGADDLMMKLKDLALERACRIQL